MEQELFKAYFDFGVGGCADGYIKVGADDVYSEKKRVRIRIRYG